MVGRNRRRLRRLRRGPRRQVLSKVGSTTCLLLLRKPAECVCRNGHRKIQLRMHPSLRKSSPYLGRPVCSPAGQSGLASIR